MGNSLPNIRLVLWLTFFGLLWLTYTVWTRDYAPQPAPPVQPEVTRAPQQPDSTVPTIEGSTTAPVAAPGDQSAPAPPTSQPTDVVHVRTDVLDVLIDLHGGDLVRADL